MCTACERVAAEPRLFEANDPPDYPRIRECNLLAHVRPETLNARWLAPDSCLLPLFPRVLIGGRQLFLSLDATVQSRAREFLMSAWQPEEARMPFSFALSRTTGSIPVPPAIAATSAHGNPQTPPSHRTKRPVVGRTSIMIADDNVTVRTMARSALENEGIQCQTGV
jgi:hypothetical protein